MKRCETTLHLNDKHEIIHHSDTKSQSKRVVVHKSGECARRRCDERRRRETWGNNLTLCSKSSLFISNERQTDPHGEACAPTPQPASERTAHTLFLHRILEQTGRKRLQEGTEFNGAVMLMLLLLYAEKCGKDRFIQKK